MKKGLKTAIILALTFLLLTGCGKSTTLDLSGADCDPNRYAYGSSAGYNVSVGDMGLFYTKEMGAQIRFYDLEAKQSYVLCSRANCTHMTDKCPAYFPLNLMGEAAQNVAQVGKYMYCTYFARATSGAEMVDAKNGAAYELLRIDPADGSRKVIASFPAMYNAAEGDEAFYASNLGSVEYCGGWAWFDLTMQQPDKNDVPGSSFCQLTGVNLETGQVVALNQYDDYNYSFVCIDSDGVIFSRRKDILPKLSEDVFFDAARGESKGSVWVGDMEFHDYSEYWDWYCSYSTKEYDVYRYTTATDETLTLFGGETIPVGQINRRDGGIFYMQYIPYDVYGSFDGKLLCGEFVADGHGDYFSRRNAYFLLDPQTGERETVLELDNGGTLAIAQGYHPNQVFPDGTLLYMNYHEDKADIYTLDLNTGESTFLFTDDEAITFRIFGEFKDGFFCKHKDHQDDMRFYWISKEDFYAGNLDAAVMYQL